MEVKKLSLTDALEVVSHGESRYLAFWFALDAVLDLGASLLAYGT